MQRLRLRSPHDREIVRLAVPAFGALITEPLYILADTAVVGHLGTNQLGGLAVASTVLLTLYAVFIFLAYGTTAAVSRLLGGQITYINRYERDDAIACVAAWGRPDGVGLRFSLEGDSTSARVIRTETELILKSRRVIPGRLLNAGFTFQHGNWPDAAKDLCRRWREDN